MKENVCDGPGSAMVWITIQNYQSRKLEDASGYVRDPCIEGWGAANRERRESRSAASAAPRHLSAAAPTRRCSTAAHRELAESPLPTPAPTLSHFSPPFCSVAVNGCSRTGPDWTQLRRRRQAPASPRPPRSHTARSCAIWPQDMPRLAV